MLLSFPLPTSTRVSAPGRRFCTVERERERKRERMEEETKKTEEQLETEISLAMRARVKDFKEQSDSLTLEGVRRALEKDLGMEVLSLDVHKRFIKQCLEECFYGGGGIHLSTTTGGSSGPCLPQMNEETSGVKDQPLEPKDPNSSSADINENAEESPAGEGMPHNGLVKAEDLKRDMELNEDKIKKAIKKRGSYFRANLEKMTLVKVRRLLEDDLNLEKSTLDTYKRFISDVLDEVLEESADATNGIDKKPKKASPNEETGKAKREPKTSNDDSGSSNLDNDMIDSDADADEVKRPKKRTLQKSKSSVKSVKRQKRSLKESKPSSSRKKKQEEPDIENRSESDAEKTSENDRSPSSSEETPKVKKSKSSMKSVNRQKISLKESKPSSSRKKKQEEPDIENRSESDAEKSSGNGRSPSSSDETPKMKQEKPTAQSYGKHVEHLKTVIKACGMGVPPAVYKRAKQAPEGKREAFLIKELEEILAKEGLSTNPSEKDIKVVKKKKERARELEGIDMSNIVSTSRRRSAFNYIPTPKPKKEVESDEHDEEDEGEEDDDEEGTEDGDNGSGESSEGSEEGADEEDSD